MTTYPPIDRLPQYRDPEIESLKTFYRINGVKFSRVTSALSVINKPALVPWARNQAFEKVRETWLDPQWSPSFDAAKTAESLGEWIDEFLEEAKRRANATKETAAELGTQAHALIHRLLEGDASAAEEIPDELRPAVHGAAQFLRDNGIQPAHTEFTVWSPDVGIAGTIDGVGWRNGNVVIWDWKRSKGIYPEMALQLGAYARLFELTTGQAVNEAWVVRLPQAMPENGAALYEARQVSDIADCWRNYTLALNLQSALKIDPWATTTQEAPHA